jgi:defect in organelle trafficking protein DotB
MNLILHPEKNKITEDDLFDILFHMVKHGASDIYLLSGDYVIMDIKGRKTITTKTQLTFGTIEKIAKKIAGDSVVTRLNSGEFIDKAFDFKRDGERFRFRINITPSFTNGNQGIQITIREIPVYIPNLEEIGCSKEDDIYKNFFPLQGLVLVTGPTGSGKSTLMASCIAAKVQEEDCHRIFNCYEAPIEFVYDDIVKPSSRIYQTQVAEVSDFSRCISNSLRRKPEVIVVGESRDQETIKASVEAAQTGHLVISTSHTTGVAATLRRMIIVFPSNERDGMQADIIDQIHMIVSQRLLRTVDGGRVAIKEKLIFTKKMKNHLLKINPLQINVAIRDILESHNEGLLIEAQKLLDDGKVSEREFEQLAMTLKNEEEEEI